jgi:hypothetical protein
VVPHAGVSPHQAQPHTTSGRVGGVLIVVGILLLNISERKRENQPRIKEE